MRAHEPATGSGAVDVLPDVHGAVAALPGDTGVAKCLALGATAVSVSSRDVPALLHTLRLAVWSAGVRRADALTPAISASRSHGDAARVTSPAPAG